MTTKWTGNIETVKPLRDGPAGDATRVVLSKGTFVKADERVDRWIRLIEPGVGAGLWVSYTWLANFQEIQETDPPPASGGLILAAGSQFIIKNGDSTLYETTQDTPLKAVVQ